MMKINIVRWLAISVVFSFFTFCIPICDGEVFTLWPFNRNKTKDHKVQYEPSQLLDSRHLWDEPVIVNGIKTSLGVSIIERDYRECLFQLKSVYPKAFFAENATSIFAEFKLKNGSLRRLYLINMGSKSPVMQFTMDLDGKIPDKFDWPDELPLFPGGTPLACIQLTDRDAFYGNFTANVSVEQSASTMKTSLISQGWKPATGEDFATYGASGDVYIKESPLRILLTSFTEDKNGEIKGSIYTRPLKK